MTLKSAKSRYLFQRGRYSCFSALISRDFTLNHFKVPFTSYLALLHFIPSLTRRLLTLPILLPLSPQVTYPSLKTSGTFLTLAYLVFPSNYLSLRYPSSSPSQLRLCSTVLISSSLQRTVLSQSSRFFFLLRKLSFSDSDLPRKKKRWRRRTTSSTAIMPAATSRKWETTSSGMLFPTTRLLVRLSTVGLRI